MKYRQFSMKSLKLLRPNTVSTQQIRLGCDKVGEEEVGVKSKTKNHVYERFGRVSIYFILKHLSGVTQSSCV